MGRKFWLKSDGKSLYADDSHSSELLAELPRDTSLLVEVSQPRNPDRLKLRWALIQVIAKAMGEDAEDISDKIKIVCGHYRELRFPNGKVERKAKSISFANMDELAFREHFEKEVQAVYHLYGILPKDAQQEID